MSKDKPKAQGGGGLMKTGVKKSLWLHEDEAEALRLRAFEERRSAEARGRGASGSRACGRRFWLTAGFMGAPPAGAVGLGLRLG